MFCKLGGRYNHKTYYYLAQNLLQTFLHIFSGWNEIEMTRYSVKLVQSTLVQTVHCNWSLFPMCLQALTVLSVCLSTKCLKQRLYGKDPTLETKINLLPALETVDCDFYRKNLCHVLEVSRFNSKVSATYLRMFGLNLH